MIRKPKVSPTEAARRDRIAREQRRTPTVSHAHDADLVAIADAAGVSRAQVFEEFGERAAIRQYDAGVTQLQAERDALEDVRDRFRPRQKGLAL